VRVETAKVIRRPPRERVVDGGIDPQKDLFTITHEVLVERPGVNYWRRRLVATENNQ
jgi:hypothetical protein